MEKLVVGKRFKLYVLNPTPFDSRVKALEAMDLAISENMNKNCIIEMK